MKRGLANAGPKPHPTTNFRSSKYGGVFAETRKRQDIVVRF